MNKKIKTTLTVLVSIIVAGGLMLLVAKSLGGNFVEKTISVVKRANYLWIGLAACFGLGAYFLRAIRWNLLLEPMGYKIHNSNALWTLSFGYFLNLGIPRMGEIGRATALQTVENVPFSKSFGTIVTERVIDLLFMLLFLLLAFIFNYSSLLSAISISISSNDKPIEINYTILYIIGFTTLLLFSLILILRKKLLQLSVVNKIISLLKGILTGLISIVKVKQKLKFTLLTIGIWVCYFFASYLIVFALPETSFIPIQTGFYLLAIGSLGMILPASGGIGAYHGAMMIGFSALFLSLDKSASEGKDIGYSYAILSHSLQMVIMIVMGLFSIVMLARNKKTKQ
ncbi:flippase-like domain-containing protein [Apibacter muscae]|uniref:lysylphosphatidylglycerol synthase transmembrane domain-containing protein n=1 Tax=Apibacter muscae TaxID=2509004 RepID=UPI0011AD3D98|nr:lysylphosphatidylglycerol synthase transmembrane domain-containing protein [Apibacter muscae]TWP24043.1 flippase-like domain-containing protein [Apibacter muscae]